MGFLLQYFIVNEGWLPSLCDVLSFEYSINLYIFYSVTSLSDYIFQFVQALTWDLKVVSSSPSEIFNFFLISLRNFIKIHFTYMNTEKRCKFRFYNSY